MLTIISPSKSVMKQDQPGGLTMTQPQHTDKTDALVQKLQKLSQRQLTKTLEVSEALGKLNYERFQTWGQTPKRAALWMYSGDVYNGIDAYSMKDAQITYAQKHLLIVSGLYGLLRPLDQIQPYRLEMRLPISIGRSKNLYEYWKSTIHDRLKKTTEKHLLLCASPEYAKAVTEALPAETQIITPRFKQETTTGLREKGLFAKYARGALARWAIDNKVTDPLQLKNYSEDGFVFSEKLSSDSEYVYIVPTNFTLKGRFKKL